MAYWFFDNSAWSISPYRDIIRTEKKRKCNKLVDTQILHEIGNERDSLASYKNTENWVLPD